MRGLIEVNPQSIALDSIVGNEYLGLIIAKVAVSAVIVLLYQVIKRMDRGVKWFAYGRLAELLLVALAIFYSVFVVFGNLVVLGL